MGIILTFGLIGYIFHLFVPFKLIWNLDTAFTAVVFYGIGFWLRKKTIVQKVETYSWQKKTICFTCGVLCSYVAIQYNNTFVNMSANQYGNIFIFYLGAFSGIITWCLIAAAIKQNKIFCFLGRNTMPVIGFNYFINYIVSLLMNIWVIEFLCSHIGNEWSYWSKMWWLRGILIGVCMLIFILTMHYWREKYYVRKYIFGEVR